MPPVSVTINTVDTEPAPHDSNFLRCVRSLARYRPHLNRCSGRSPVYRRKKLAGERALHYEDVVALLRGAREDGARRGQAAEMVCVLLNQIVADTLDVGDIPDVIVKPFDADDAAAPVTAVDEEELHFCRATSRFIAKTGAALADGVLDPHEARELHAEVRTVEARGRRLLVAAERKGREALL